MERRNVDSVNNNNKKRRDQEITALRKKAEKWGGVEE